MDTTPPPLDPNLDPPVIGRHDGFDVYPMPAFLSVPCRDITRSRGFYVDVLGFSVMFTGPDVDGVPTLIHLRRGKYQDVLLTPAPPNTSAALTPTVTVADVDAIADLLGDRTPLDQPWGSRDLRVADPDGNQLVLTQPPQRPLAETVDEVMERAVTQE